MNPTVLIAPSGFKESLLPWQAAQAMARGVQQAWPEARVLQLPLVDGGEGFAEGLARATGGGVEPVQVCGPVGQRLAAHLGWLGPVSGRSRTAVVEVAAAAGLRWVPQDRRNPLHTTSRGVGELIRAALDRGAERILLGCGDSGINDGGAGMVQALGARLTDADGHDIGPGAEGLLQLDRIDLTGLDPRLQRVPIHAAVNPGNRLLGPRGVARVHGPQKGASAGQVERLEQALSLLTSFTEDMARRGKSVESVWLSRAIQSPAPEEVMALGLGAGDRVARLERVRRSDGVPLAIERASLSSVVLPDPDQVEASLYAVLEARGMRPVRAVQRISAANLGVRDAELLGVPAGAAGLRTAAAARWCGARAGARLANRRT